MLYLCTFKTTRKSNKTEHEPGIEVVSDGNEGCRLHNNILTMEDSLPPMPVHYPVLVCVDQELSGPY